ncbi:MAG: FKBP-type peptidyl-prolyl cis-trans isomerase [Oscillochloris sp.]|nr:FKBP-type peptidyl-prolyl cis-trans isomerase [Oscillochloris sp.]
MVALSACGSAAPAAAPTSVPEPTAVVVEPTAAPAPTAGTAGEENVLTTPSGLQYIELSPGTGPAPVPGDLVSVHYRGTLADGSEFDSSYSRGEPFSFALGQGMVIPGWDEGIGLMKQGGKARLIIPPDLGYGARGFPPLIPANATLTFEVELVDIQAGAPAAPTSVDEADYTTTPTGLKYYDFVVGDGATATPGSTVVVHYTGWLLDGGKFDSSLDRGQPFSFSLGAGQVIRGWDEGVAGMQVGGRRQLVIPAELGYGDRGAGDGAIPPGATLVFEIELLAVQ